MIDAEAWLAEIEDSLADGTYRKGEWTRFLAHARRLPQRERRALSRGVSRVSDQLHRAKGRPTFPFAAALAAEWALVGLGAAAIREAERRCSNLLALAALGSWTAAFQPLVKIAVGSALGIRYSYAFLWGPEPRFKMRHGTFVAASRPARLAFQLAGGVGSPLGAALVGVALRRRLPLASNLCFLTSAAVVGVNTAFFVAGWLGRKEVLGVPVGASSTGAAAREWKG